MPSKKIAGRGKRRPADVEAAEESKWRKESNRTTKNTEKEAQQPKKKEQARMNVKLPSHTFFKCQSARSEPHIPGMCMYLRVFSEYKT